jgi:phage major head subunit gpT-like protein
MKKRKPIIAIEAPITIAAAEGEDNGPPSFEVVAYTGGALSLVNFEYPVVVDVAGMSFGKSIVANLDHEKSQRVGNVTAITAQDGQLTLGGKVTAATDAAREVVESSKNGFVWQASIEAQPDQLTEVKAGKEITVNGQDFTGPLFLVAKSTVKGFAFVSHGADDETSVSIAAEAAVKKGNVMREKVKTWIKATLPSLDIDSLTDEQTEQLEADYDGREGKRKPTKKLDLGDAIEATRIENERIESITTLALEYCERMPFNIDAIKKLAEEAIEAKWTIDKFRLELLEATLPPSHSVFRPKTPDARLNNRVLEAAICMTGRLANHEDMFDDQTLQAAHDRFPRGIGLGQLLLIGAEANGYRGNHSSEVTIDAQRAAFGMTGPQQIQAGFSTVVIPDILAATANKFLHEGWMAVDMTPMAISAVRNVRNFQQTTTVSLTGHLQFEELGASGEIKHGTVADLTYTNQADTYAKMLAITRKDIINDDMGALTAVPRRLGRGGALKLNDLFWTVFLNNSTFFVAGNSNVNTGVADMTIGGLTATEVIFMDQTDPDSKPLGVMPAILLVPTPLKAAAMTLMDSQNLIDGSSTAAQGQANIFRGRFRVESSPYMSNSSYTGYSAAAWYMLADPAEMPVVEIAALNGNVMPVVETADADFNVLGIQMRGYSDVGVAMQEYRGGVRADGGAS